MLPLAPIESFELLLPCKKNLSGSINSKDPSSDFERDYNPIRFKKRSIGGARLVDYKVVEIPFLHLFDK